MAGALTAQPRGLFGAPRRMPQIDPNLGAMIAREQGIMPGDQPGLPQTPAQQPAEPQKRDTLRRIAGYFADFTAGLAGHQGPYASMLAQQAEQAERLRQASLGREQEWQDWVKREEWKRANPTASDPWIQTEDNAGNVHLVNRDTGEQRTVFVDPNDKVFLQDGQLVTVPNVVRSGQAPKGPQPGAIVNGHRFLGGNPNDRASWAPVGQGGPQLAPAGGFRP